MWNQMMTFLESWFNAPGLTWDIILTNIALAIVFGAVWLCAHWPPLFTQRWLWAVGVVSAFFSLLAVVFVQIPLQTWANEALDHFWTPDVIFDWMWLTGLPYVMLSGLVQEGAKMVPMVVFWWRSGRNITPKMGLAIGAIAGAGLGIFEAVWAHNQIFMAGWTWDLIGTKGILELAGFWDRFFVVAFHISASAIAGYGLAKGRGWQYYLIAAGLHTIINYVIIPYRHEIFTFYQSEIYVAAIAVLVTLLALWPRWLEKDRETEGIDI